MSDDEEDSDHECIEHRSVSIETNNIQDRPEKQTEDHVGYGDVTEKEDDVIDKFWPPPCEKTVRMIGSFSGKTISAFAFNNEGTRFVAGGHDNQVKIWDFDAISGPRAMPIASVEPSSGAVIKQLDFSADDEWILVISASCQAVIMAKDGIVDNKEGICVKGDQYISDMTHTKGHVQMLNDGCWRPTDGDEFITCSNDATIRIWDPIRLDQHKTVIKTKSANGLKTIPNVCKYSRDAISIVSGCQDGSIMMWDTRRKFITTSSCIRNAHLKGSEITGLDFSHDMYKLCTRSEDESCKIWDLRQLKRALATRTGLTTAYTTTDCCFSPDDKTVMSGTSGTKNCTGEVHFMDSNDLSTKHLIELESNTPGASVVRVRWHSNINHVAYTSSDGQVCVTYDSRRSLGGGFVPSVVVVGGGGGEGQQTTRGKKRRKNFAIALPTSSLTSASSALAIKKIITPHALPSFRDDSRTNSASGGGSAIASRMRSDPKRAYKPELPASVSHQGGHTRPAGSTLSSYIARNIAKPIDDDSVSIRDRILRHADEAERAPFWIKPSAATAATASASSLANQPTMATTNKQKQEERRQN